jgi:Ala-tRNA(Pro) deacylase
MAFGLLLHSDERGHTMKTLIRCLEYLDRSYVVYSHSIHSPAYTAREVAAAERIPADEIAKTVVYFGDNGFGMVVLPADCLVNFAEVGRLMGLSHVRLASEAELAGLFPGSDLGAMPPFWNETEMPVLVDENVAAAEFIAFNAGTHRDVIRMSLADFRRLVNPLIAAFAVKEQVLASI